MTTAKIEIKARNVDMLGDNAQHMYIVYTNEAGEEYVLSAFPAINGKRVNEPISMFVGDLEVVDVPYNNDSLDWDKSSTHSSQPLFSGTDAEMIAKVQLMKDEVKRVNEQGYDYNLPIIETLIPSWGDLNDQNSNTVAMQLAKVAGLESGVNSFIQNNNLNVPGYQATLEHSLFEKSASTLYNAVKDTYNDIGDFVNDAIDYVSGSISDKMELAKSLLSSMMGDQNIDQSQFNDFKLYLKDYLEQQLQQSLTDEAFDNMLSQMSQAEATQIVRRYDPLVLDLDGDGVELTGVNNSNAYFDLDSDNMNEKTGWVAPDDAFLALDKNDNGNIDDIGELFGNQNQSGFSELSGYDSNNDNKIDSSDDIYSSLKLWQDKDGDGKTDEGELVSLENAQISAINLDGQVNVNRNVDGNLIKTVGSYSKADGTTGQVADIDFNVNQSDSQFNGDYDLNINTIFLPFLKGYGDVKALHISASEDETLMNKLSGLNDLQLGNYNNIDSLIEDIVFNWAGTSEATGNRGVFSAQKLATLEKFRGEEFRDNWGNVNITTIQRPIIENAWEELFSSLKTKLLIQSTFKDIFNASYNLATDSIEFSANNNFEVIKSLAEEKLGEITDYKAKADFAMQINAIFANQFSDQADNTLSLKIDNIINIAEINGSNNVNAGAENDLIIGDENSNIINSSSGDDAIIGGQGNDHLVGSHGDDTYIYNKGDGSDVINEYNNDRYYYRYQGQNLGDDKIKFGDDISKENLLFQKSGNSLIIKFLDTETKEVIPADQITITNHFYGTANKIENLEFADGETIDLTDASSLTFNYQGTDNSETINTGSSFNDVIDAKAGNDTIYANAGDDKITGGTGNDHLVGSHGDDTYIYNKGDGSDVINEYNNDRYYYRYQGQNLGDDKIKFGEDISKENLLFQKSGNSLIIKFLDDNGNVTANDQITITNHFYGTANKIENLEFADGETIDLTNPEELTFNYQGTDNAETINTGSEFADVIDAKAGNDTIYANAGDDKITGGTGNDHLVGSHGDDTYIYNKGDGSDVINEYNNDRYYYRYQGQNLGDDKIKFGEDISKDNLLFQKSGNSLIIKFLDTETKEVIPTDQITITNHFYGTANKIENLEFADGETIDLTDASSLTFNYQGTDNAETINTGSEFNDVIDAKAGNDTIYANNGDDQITGGTGNDHLVGSHGDDTYIYNKGDGSDVINEYNNDRYYYRYQGQNLGDDKIKFGEDISKENLLFQKSGNSLIIKFLDDNGNVTANDQITITNHFYGTANKIESLEFSNGDKIDLTSDNFESDIYLIDSESRVIEDFQIDYDKVDFSQFDTINSKEDFEMNAFESNMWEEDESGNLVETEQTVINISANGTNIQIEDASLEEFTENNFIFE